jgi:hypothetical protein
LSVVSEETKETAPPSLDGAPEMLDEARRLVDRARERDIVLLGGLAIRLLTPELPPRTRVGQDLDFGSVKSSRKALIELLAEEGYVADRNFNALYGDKQLYFAHGTHGHAVDVMIDRLHMCHTVPFADRATVLPYTLSPVDLLLSKLQIVELNEKDLDDILRLLVSFDLAESAGEGRGGTAEGGGGAAEGRGGTAEGRRGAGEGGGGAAEGRGGTAEGGGGAGGDPVIDLSAIAELVGDDWGWWKTISLNLDRIDTALADGTPPLPAGARRDPHPAVAALRRTLEETPKSRRWRLRAKVGERKRWYELPEETPHH